MGRSTLLQTVLLKSNVICSLFGSITRKLRSACWESHLFVEELFLHSDKHMPRGPGLFQDHCRRAPVPLGPAQPPNLHSIKLRPNPVAHPGATGHSDFLLGLFLLQERSSDFKNDP